MKKRKNQWPDLGFADGFADGFAGGFVAYLRVVTGDGEPKESEFDQIMVL